MRLRKIKYELKQNNREMEMHSLEDEGGLKLEDEKEAPDARKSDSSDDSAALNMRSQSPVSWISLNALKIVILIMQKTVTTTIESA